MSDTKNYAKCTDCGKDLPTQADGNAHMSETLPGTPGVSGHRIRILNPTPEQVARRTVGRVIERAIDRFFEEMTDEVDRGSITTEEVTAALRDYPDFADAWDEYVEESA